MKKSKDLERLEADSAWVTQHYDRLEKYQGKVVAIKNKGIIAVSENLETLLEELEKKEKPACLLLEAIPPKNVSFIL